MVVDELPVRGAKLAVDVRRDQGINRETTRVDARHGRDSGAEAYQTTSGVHAKCGTSRFPRGCSTSPRFLRTKTLPRLVTRPPGGTPRATRRPLPAARAPASRASEALRALRQAPKGRTTAYQPPDRRHRCRPSSLLERGLWRGFSPCCGGS